MYMVAEQSSRIAFTSSIPSTLQQKQNGSRLTRVQGGEHASSYAPTCQCREHMGSTQHHSTKSCSSRTNKKCLLLYGILPSQDAVAHHSRKLANTTHIWAPNHYRQHSQPPSQTTPTPTRTDLRQL